MERTKTCGPYPGGFVLTHTHLGGKFTSGTLWWTSFRGVTSTIYPPSHLAMATRDPVPSKGNSSSSASRYLPTGATFCWKGLPWDAPKSIAFRAAGHQPLAGRRLGLGKCQASSQFGATWVARLLGVPAFFSWRLQREAKRKATILGVLFKRDISTCMPMCVCV